MTGMLGELAVATGIALGVLSTAAVVGHQRQVAHARLLERSVAVQAAEGVLVHAREAAQPAGTYAFDLQQGLPASARLPGASAQFEVRSVDAGLAEIVVTVRWTVSGGSDAVVRRAVVEYPR